MVKKIINVGVEGNDATGDPIREAFTKTNENFNELYAVFGKGDGFNFTNLADYDATRNGELVQKSIFIVNDAGDTILAKTIEGDGIKIDNTDANKIVFRNTGSSLVGDSAPQLGGDLDGQNLWTIGNLREANDSDATTLNADISSFVVTRKGGDARYLNTFGDTATGPLRIRPQPTDTTEYIKPILGFSTEGRALFSDPHGISIEFNGAAYRYTAGSPAINLSNNLVYYVRYYDNNTLGLYPTATDAINDSNRIHASSGTSQQLVDADLDLSVAGNYLLSEAVPRDFAVRRQGDTMDGVLLLNADPNESSLPLTAASKNYVDTTAFSSNVNIFVSTGGKDFRYDIIDSKRGTALAYAFKTINQACFKAGQIIDSYERELGPYQKPIFYSAGAHVSQFISISESLGKYTLKISNGGVATGVDARGTGSIAAADIRAGLLIRGTSSGATVVIDEVGEINTGAYNGIDIISGNEDYVVRYKKFASDGSTPVQFIFGEELEYGETVSALNVTIYVESGEYYENLPIRVPPNVSLCGDDLRRVIIRPKTGPSGSIWSDAHFRRDPTIDTLDVLNLMNVGTFKVGATYKVADLGTTNQSRWKYITGSTDDVAINLEFTAHATGAYTAGDFSYGVHYVIASLGTTNQLQWNSIAGTTGVTYQIGSTFTGTNQSGAAMGNGTAYVVGGGSAHYYDPHGYHYLTDPTKSLYSSLKLSDITGQIWNGQRILHANRAFIQDDIISYIDYKYSVGVTATSANGNITVNNVNNLTVGMPIKFSATKVTEATHTDGDGNIRLADITGLTVGATITFSGNPFGGIANNTTYYVTKIDNIGGTVLNKNISVSLTAGVNTIDIGTTEASGIMTATINTTTFGGSNIDEVRTYYIKTINSGTNKITISNTLSGSTQTLNDATGNMTLKWVYNTDYCHRDVGSFVDAIGFDLIYGGYSKSLEAAMSFFMNSSAMIVVGDQLAKTLDSIGVRLRLLVKKVINQDSTGFVTSGTAKRSNTPQIVDVKNSNGVSIQAEDSYSDTTIDQLIQLILDVLNKDESVNFPKKNNEMDVLLLNDSNRVRTLSGQGHGGFMCVLDPSGQILTKSPYIQQCSSFSKSINSHHFAGGVFVDAFTGNLKCVIEGKNIDNGNLTVNVSGLIYRKPQTPCAFVIDGITYEVDYIYPYDITTGLATLHINKNTPDTNNLLTNTTIIEIQTAGNRSMLASDFTQINDLGYGIFVTNNAFFEAVSIFCYYNYRAFYALNGAQIRSLNGSCGYGKYALNSEGSDPTEVPTTATLLKPMIKVFPTYSGAVFPDANKAGALKIYVVIDEPNDVPFTTTQIEIDFNDLYDTPQNPPLPITTISIKNAVQVDSNHPTIYILTIATDGNTATADLALKYDISRSINIIVRNSKEFALTGLKTLQPTRPSNALRFTNDHNVYHILQYIADPTNDDPVAGTKGALVDLNESITYITLEPTGTTYGAANHTRIDIKPLSNVIGSTGYFDTKLLQDPSHPMIFGWGSSVHEIRSYTRVNDSLAYITIYPALTKDVFQRVDVRTATLYLRAGFKAGVIGSILTQISLVRATGHDLVDIGTGSFADSNIPNNIYGGPVTVKNQANEVQEIGEGRVFYATTDQDGNIRFGKYFAVNQGTGSVKFSANVGISNLESLQFTHGVEINLFSADATMGGHSPFTVPVESAISDFVSRRLGLTYLPDSDTGQPISKADGRLGPGFIAADGSIKFGTLGDTKTEIFDMDSHKISNVAAPTGSGDAANKGYVDTFLRRSGDIRSGVDTFSMSSITTFKIKTVARTSNVATITFDYDTGNLIDGTHGLSVGSIVTIRELSGSSLTGFNAVNAVVTGVTSTSFTYSNTGTDLTTTTVASAYVDTVSNIGMNNGKITSLADPTVNGDAANYKYVNVKANIGALNDVTLTNKTDNQILYYNSNSTKWINGFLTNSNVSTSAAIAQSKLALKIATTYDAKPTGASVADGAFIPLKSYIISNVGDTNWDAVTGQTGGTYAIGTVIIAATAGTANKTGTAFENIQANSGLSSFDAANFSLDNGFVSLKASGIPLGKLATMNKGVLGNTTSSAANPAVVTFANALDNALTSAGTGVISRTTGDTVSFTTVGYGSTNTGSTLVQRDANGDFTARTITASLSGTATNATNVAVTSDAATTAGYVTFVSGNSGNNGIKVSNMMYDASTNVLTTTATQAYYADLAEYYESDQPYNPGTVVMIGGDKEITTAKGEGTTKVAGVVSKNPAYLMNVNCPGSKLAIALTGRVPCKVVGKIEKGDLLVVSMIPGVAMSSNNPKPGSIIGKALSNYNSSSIGTIEVLVGKH